MRRSYYLSAGVVLALAGPARAQTASEKASAEALFQAGRELLAAGKYADACAKLEASQRLDAGLGTLLYLADCYEKAGRLASAWATFKEAESLAMARSEPPRAQVALKRAIALEPRLPKLWIKMADGNPPDTQVKRNGAMVPRESWGLALPVDAGEQRVEVSAPGRKPWSTTISIPGEATNTSLDVPLLEQAPMEEKPAAPAPAPAAPLDSGPVESESTGSGQRTIGLVVGGVGIVGIGVGSFFGLRAKSKNDDSKAHCPNDPNVCDAVGTELRNDAKSAAGLSTAFMIGGGALLATGIVVFLTAPSGSGKEARVSGLHVAADVGRTQGQLTLGGAF